MELESYSRRNAEPKENIFSYNEIPLKLRNQIILIIDNTIGYDLYVGDELVEQLYEKVWDKYELEHGKLDEYPNNVLFKYRVLDTLKKETNLDQLLDMIEFCLQVIDKLSKLPNNFSEQRNAKMLPKNALSEVNKKFLQASVGYQFIDGIILKISNELLYQKLIIPAINLLDKPAFKNANDEYMMAHTHFKAGLNKECLNECLKALESTLKIIYTLKDWQYDTKAGLAGLIDVAYDNKLIPDYLKTQLGALRTILTSGVNTIRNKIGGHGQGPNINTANDETTRYTLNLTGANIIYLIEMSKLV